MPFFPNPAAPRVTQAVPLVKRVGSATVELRPPAGGLKAGRTEATLVVTPSGAVPTLDLSMPAMAMMTVEKPTLAPGVKPGEYRLSMSFPHGGRYRLTVALGNDKAAFGIDVASFDDNASSPLGEGMKMDGMNMMSMSGTLGPWSMAREGSGTSWMPDESPMFMKDLGTKGRYSLCTWATSA